MSTTPSPTLLGAILRTVVRGYQVPDMAVPTGPHLASPAARLAMTIEQARQAVAHGKVPDVSLKRRFVDALAGMVGEAMHPDSGDPAFQAMVLRQRMAPVREFATLSARAEGDRRVILSAVNAVAHPGRQQRMAPGWQREALADLHASAASSSWSALRAIAQRLLDSPDSGNGSPVAIGLARLLDNAALQRLQRMETLEADEAVRRHRSLWDRAGPRPGSATALARGVSAQQRGAGAEALAEQALQALVQRLNEADGDDGLYRVVTSLRVPASIPASHERAKTEWDVVLLRRAPVEAMPAWDVCLLVEVKASVDAATTDFPRLLRGIGLLAHAKQDAAYMFESRQGTVCLRGAALSALRTSEPDLQRTVLYCCDARAEAAPRLLSAASRMQLLSADQSLAFASHLAANQHADVAMLEPVWHLLLASDRWKAVLNQYSTLRQVRGLMVNTEDLLAAIRQAVAKG
ncbi:3-deoxy-D-arabino-heptulosonate 7-phosphate synthase [Cupriavidus sp. WKF15]|uniref:3-deoxy-D-arabino-heptulosonate 7-phosphate synthase n=1 Tax=Cupriavidus sp. WKF15 TaxID=3032282 RepID=UPI0023E2C974|nr:3-deoxy-D-arabino-heptulosonate 7-phosphate synthase [Cupriavidus sp. WKF15]WER47484.1 3-deoxy-D-arabino-heptulosonate 7-phosphate synthase [Cupriavidus sp. WKF15]